MSDQNHIDRIWTIIEKVGVCMLTTRFEGGLRARPVEARPDRASNRLLFMTDAHSPKLEEMEHWPEVCLIFIDTAEKAYLSISGTARIVDDDAELRSVTWRKNDVVWWPGGPNDPNACLLVVEPAIAELWDGPSSNAVAAYEFAKARATRTEPNLGENRKVTVHLQE
jgi:general stress protein 26